MIIEINPVNCGIYSITHKESGQAYVGSSIDIRSRICQHLKKLSQGKHENAKIQSLYNSSEGNTAFECRILEACSEDELDEREAFHIETGNSELNIATTKFGRQARKIAGRKPRQTVAKPKPPRKTRSDKKSDDAKRAAKSARQAERRAEKRAAKAAAAGMTI